MWGFRLSLRRSVNCAATHFARFRRAQHGYPPHKEYFQNPGQNPVLDLPTPTYQPVVPNIADPQSSSYLRRGVRSVLWACLFGSIGAIAGTGMITFDYLNTPVELDEAETEEYMSEILEELRSHPLVDGLIEDKWQAQRIYTQRTEQLMEQGLEFIYERLIGTRGVTIEEYTHPTAKYTILAFFLSDGLEGWPDTVHGGIVTSMLLLAAQRHAKRFYAEDDFEMDPNGVSIDVNFKATLRPDDIYAIMVPPAAVTIDWSAQSKKAVQKQLTLMPMLMQMDGAPQITTQIDPVAQTETHTVAVSSYGADVYADATVQCQFIPRVSETGG